MPGTLSHLTYPSIIAFVSRRDTVQYVLSERVDLRPFVRVLLLEPLVMLGEQRACVGQEAWRSSERVVAYSATLPTFILLKTK